MANHVLDVGAAPTVNPTPLQGNDYERIQASPDAFGAQIGRAEAGLGQAVEGAGTTGLDILTQQQDLQDEIHSSEVNTDLANKITDRYSQFAKLQGRAAQDALPQFKADIDALQKQAVGAAGNLKSQAMIAKSSAFLTDSYYRYATNHADQQFDTWQRDTATRRAATMGGQASIAATNGDVQGLDAFLNASDDEVRKLKEGIKGYDPDALAADLSKNRGRNVANAVEQLALVGTAGTGPNLDMAKAVFEKYKDQMDPESRLAVEKYLAPKMLQRQAQTNADLILGGPGLMPTPGGSSPIQGPGHGRGSINAPYLLPLDQAPHNGGPSPQNLYTYLTSKGATRNEALMLTSAAANEGVMNPNAVHDGGIGFGLWGHNRERLAAMQMMYGKNPTWQQQADYALHELRARPEGALVNSATTPVELANAEMHYEQPRAYTRQDPQAGENYNGRLNTIRYFTKLAAPGDVTEAQGTPPQLDKSAAIQKAIDIAGDNPALRAATISEINRRFSQYNAANATERQALELDVPNKIAAAEAGVPITDFPEARIRAVYPPAKAQALIDQFAIAQRVGTVISGIQFASPDEVLAAQRDIESGQGTLSTMMKAHARFETTGPGTIGADATDELNGGYFKLREQASKRLQQVITQRSKMLYGSEADPASYVQAEPSVAAAMKAAQKDPSKLGDYVNATLGVQAHLGVPEDGRHILTRGQAIDMAQQLQNSGTDVRTQLTGLQQRFGQHYGQVFSDLVRLGKLPSTYQAVAVLPDHDDANLLARALQQSPGGGEDGKKLESWNDRIIAATGDAQAPKNIRDSVNTNTTMQSYLQSLKRQGLSGPMIDAIQKDVQLLAYAKSYWQKADASTAATQAVEAFTKQFTFLPGGDARIPSAIADDVTKHGDELVANLDAAHVRLPANVGGPMQPSGDDFIADIRARHTWINTPRGDGLMLLDGAGKPVVGKDGTPYIVPFSTTSVTPTVRDSSTPMAGP